MQTHNNGTVSLTYYNKTTEIITFTETQNTKKRAKPKIVQNPLYACICN